MNISGKIYVFVNEKEYENEKGVAMTRNTYATSISKTDEDGEYVHAYMDVRFSNNLVEAYKLNKFCDGDCLEVDIKEGWLGFNYWTDKQGNERRAFYVFVNGADIEEYVKEDKKKTSKQNNKKSTSKRK